jgi:transglutaminase-like putative cysteine protease
VTGRRRLGLVAASATLLASAPLSTIFAGWTWLFECILAVGMIAGAAVLARTLRFPTWAQAVSMVAALLFVLTWMFSSGGEFLALLPTPATFEHFGALFSEAGTDTRQYGIPVPDRDGLLFVTVLGIGSVAIAVDLFTVALRRPALAGLPMLAIYSVPVAVYIDSVPVFPFVIGSIGFLWLLVADNVDRVRRFGRRFTGDGRDVDVWEPSPLAAAGRRLAAMGLVAAVLVPLAVPGLTTGLLSRLTQVGDGTGGAGTGGGGGGRINLFASLSGQLNQSAVQDLISVTTNEPDPFYLRIAVADVVNSQGFVSRANSGRAVARGLPDPRQNPQTEGATYTQYRATVEATGLAQHQAPIYPSVLDVDDLDGNWYYDSSAQAVYSPRTTTKDKKYSFDYVRARYTPAALRTAKPLSADDPLRTQFTSVPPDKAVAALVNRLTRTQTNDYDKVRAIYGYFSRANGFSYNLQTQGGTTGSEIASFLLTNKTGFCQQYSAAMAWMVRQAGIPARVAFGFTRGGKKDGNTYVITNRNAHAWTEVYLSGFGWVPFDATPASGVVGAARPDWAPDTETPTPTASAPSGAAAPGADPSAAAGRPNAADREPGPGNVGAGGSSTTDSGSANGLLFAGIGALLVLLLLVPAFLRSLLRRRRHAATVPKTVQIAAGGPAPPGVRDVVVTTEVVQAREDAHAAWDELVDTMIDFRVPVDPTETPRLTAQRLVREAALTAEPADSMTLLGSAEERARYARQPLQGGELTAALGQVRKGLARSATRPTRIAAVLLPPSVLLRWRLAVGDASATWVEAFSRGRDLLTRWSPRRLLTGRSR